MTNELSGKVAIVTGAGRGIGRAEALGLASAGASVVVNDLGSQPNGVGADQSCADSVVSEIRAFGGSAIANYGDVASMQTGEELVQQALDSFGRLDLLVNNAGILRPKPFFEMTEIDWDLLIGTHLKGHFAVTHAAVQQFIHSGGGRIVNTSSDAGFGLPLFAAYAAAKEGVTGLTRTLAMELAPYDILVNQIRPRTADTRMFKISVEAGKMMGADLNETLESASGAGLFASPESFGSEWVAALIVFLCSDGANGITGQDFGVGGGFVSSYSGIEQTGVFNCQKPDCWEQFRDFALKPETYFPNRSGAGGQH